MQSKMPTWRSSLSRRWVRALGWLKSVAQAALPPNAWLRLTGLLRGRLVSRAASERLIEAWQHDRHARSTQARAHLPQGVNVVGYHAAAKGIGEAARRTLVAAVAAAIHTSVVDYEVDIPASIRRESLSISPQTGFAFNTNLLHINPPQLPYLWAHYSGAELAIPYSVGIWYWELSRIPESWRSAFGLVDEIWAGSRFVQDGMSAVSSVPVVLIPPCVGSEPDLSLTRRSLGLPPEAFLCLCAYDLLSSTARKNPEGAIRAFKRAFPIPNDRVGLIVKVSNSAYNPDALKDLRGAVGNRPDIQLLDQPLSRAGMSGLINLVDAFVSLHRSEGFGLIGAEAMFLGKPAVMTRWSGNVDYMSADNSCGVDYLLVPVGSGADPYPADAMWAEPDVDQAAGYLRRLFDDHPYYDSISRNAIQTMRRDYSPDTIGAMMRRRLQEVGVLS